MYVKLLLFGHPRVHVKAHTHSNALPLLERRLSAKYLSCMHLRFFKRLWFFSDHQQTLSYSLHQAVAPAPGGDKRFHPQPNPMLLALRLAHPSSQVPRAVLPHWRSLGHPSPTSTCKSKSTRGHKLLVCRFLCLCVLPIRLRVLVERRRAIREPDLGPATVKVLNARYLLRRFALLGHLLVGDLLALERD